MPDRLVEINSFKSASVLVVGDVMLDRYLWGTVDRISPEAPVPIVRVERETVKPGGAANVAANAAALGASVGLIGLIGHDRDADCLTRAIEGRLGSIDLIPSANRSTTVKTRVVAHGQHVVRLDNENAAELDPESAEILVSALGERVTGVDVLILSDYGKGMLTEPIVRELIGKCRIEGIPVLADPKGKNFDKYSGASVLTPNRREAAEACKLEESDPQLVYKAGNQLLNEYNLDSVLITESENGMTVFPKDGTHRHFDASAKEVFDVTGAGDTVIACLGVALAAGLSLPEAVRLSNIAAGLSVQHIGTATISFDELEGELNRLTSNGK